MNTLTKTTTTMTLVAAAVSFDASAAQVQKVSFESAGHTLVGNLYLPESYLPGEKLPAVVVTGAWTSVKEQMPSNYAKKLADKGYAALTFDFRGWGESSGDIKYLESPQEKITDIHAAVNFLVTLDQVDANKIGGLGICASAGYISDVAASNVNMSSFALVAPWLHNRSIVNDVYGGKDSVNGLIAIARASNGREYLEAASTNNPDSLMYQAPFYTESHRGAIAEYDNKFNTASWEPWLTYDAIETASMQTKPGLLIHSLDAAIPQGAQEYARNAGDNIKLVMLEDITQFDFYDAPATVTTSVNLINEHFMSTL
jgi:fermentation-respiration switch protein FrsA (DUF1100 family)